MKAIILAAGMGTRLKHKTNDVPKCLAIELNGKPLLDIQIDVFRKVGITDIVVVRGYRGETIPRPGIRMVWNHQYRQNNILGSLMCAEEELSGDVLISYCDIMFSDSVVKKLLDNKADVVLAVDTQWKEHYIGRLDHPISEAEAVIFDSCQRAKKIGKISDVDADAEFIGMLKLNDSGCRKIRECYHKAKACYDKRSFQRAALFEKAYLTDLMQEMADSGWPAACQIVGHDWQEIDTLEDLEKAQFRWRRFIEGE